MSDTHIAVNACGIVVKGEKAFLVLLSKHYKGSKSALIWLYFAQYKSRKLYTFAKSTKSFSFFFNEEYKKSRATFFNIIF